MNQWKRVVLGLDLTPESKPVWLAGARLARTFGAKLVQVHAIPETEEHSPDFGVVAARAEELLEEFAEQAAAYGVEVEGSWVRSGDPARVVSEAARELEASLVVVGAGARSRLERVLLGSTAEALTRSSGVPVWLVRPSHPREVPKSLAVAVGLDEPSRQVLEVAAFWARLLVVPLRVLHVGPDGEALRRFMDRVDLHNVEVEVEHRTGEVGEQLVAALRDDGACALIVGSEGRTGWSRLRKANTAERVLREVPSDLLVIPTCED